MKTISRSENVTSFFAAERRASLLYGTHDLIGVFVFYPNVDSHKEVISSRINNLRVRMNSLEKKITEENLHHNVDLTEDRFLTELNKKIEHGLNTLKDLDEKCQHYQEIDELEKAKFMESTREINNKIVKMDEIIMIQNVPSYKRISSSLRYQSNIEVGDALIIDEKPINAVNLFNYIVIISALSQEGRTQDIRLIIDNMMSNIGYNHHALIMSKAMKAKEGIIIQRFRNKLIDPSTL